MCLRQRQAAEGQINRRYTANIVLVADGMDGTIKAARVARSHLLDELLVSGMDNGERAIIEWLLSKGDADMGEIA